MKAERAAGRREPSPAEDRLKAKIEVAFPGRVRDARTLPDRAVDVVIDRADLVDLCRFLKDELRFQQLSCITAVDWVDRFETVYHLLNYETGQTVEIHAQIPHDDPRVASLVPLWNAANYHEREAWDLMGIVFEGHPNLERILLPRDFGFHPLRKEFPQEVDRQYISRRKLAGG